MTEYPPRAAVTVRTLIRSLKDSLDRAERLLDEIEKGRPQPQRGSTSKPTARQMGTPGPRR